MENWRPFGSFPSKSAEAASTENSATKKKKKRKKKKNRSNAPLPAQNTTEPCGLWDGYPPIPNEAAPIPSLIPAGYISETTKRERRERKKRIEKDALDKRERPVITLSQTTMQAIGQIQQQLDHLDSAETCQEEPMEISYHDLPSPADDSQPPWNTRYETAYGLKQEAGCANSMNVDPGDDIDVSDLVGEGGMTDDYNPLYKPSKLQFDPYFECEARRGFERVQGFRKRSKFADIQEKLPISKQKTEIISLIENNPVTVISGETGSGKSTQVPQFILDTAIAKGKASQTYVVVTQPRRISAIALAARVSEERGEKVGESVGYKIRLEAKAPRNRGSILFCTYGIVLRWLHGDPDLSRVSHIVMDEVHERDLNSDFTLIIIRDILRRRPELKIILMSATLDADLFSKYFFDAPCINVPGVIFPVKQIFLEDIIERLNYFFPKRAQLRQGRMPREYLEMPDKAEGMAAWQAYQMAMCKWKQENQTKFHRKTQEVIMSWDESVLELELIVALVQRICGKKPSEEAILIFLPGWADISKLLQLLQKEIPSSIAIILPLHSLLPQLDQRQVETD